MNVEQREVQSSDRPLYLRVQDRQGTKARFDLVLAPEVRVS